MYNFAMLAGPAMGGTAESGGAPVWFLTGDMLLEEQLAVLPSELLGVESSLFIFGIIKLGNFFTSFILTAAS